MEMSFLNLISVSDPDSLNPPDLDPGILLTQGPNPGFAESGSTHLDPDQDFCMAKILQNIKKNRLLEHLKSMGRL
jgi:hypothetical protein